MIHCSTLEDFYGIFSFKYSKVVSRDDLGMLDDTEEPSWISNSSIYRDNDGLLKGAASLRETNYSIIFLVWDLSPRHTTDIHIKGTSCVKEGMR